MFQKAANISINRAIFKPQLVTELIYGALGKVRQNIELFQQVFLAFHMYDNSVSYMK